MDNEEGKILGFPTSDSEAKLYQDIYNLQSALFIKDENLKQHKKTIEGLRQDLSEAIKLNNDMDDRSYLFAKSLRDEFAISALEACIMTSRDTMTKEEIADWCYDMAEIMLQRRERGVYGHSETNSDRSEKMSAIELLKKMTSILEDFEQNED